MDARPDSRPTAPDRFGARQRPKWVPLALTALVHAIALTLFLLQKSQIFVALDQPGLKTFMLPAESESDTPVPQERKQVQAVQQAASPPAEPEQPPPPLPDPAPTRELQMPFIQMSRQDFNASNISRIPSQRRAQAGELASAAPASGPGEGPGGATLYPADWYRPPTDTELAGYLRTGHPARGWGRIACRTVERFRVEDCYVLGESPMGSGFGRSVLNAAWQFQIQPPRINGRYEYGTWVKIQIIYSPEGTDSGAGG